MRVLRTVPPDHEVTLPSEELLAGARSLRTSFPSARLRPVALARVGEADGRNGARIWFALESLQVTGSFKVRGALLALARLPDTHVVASSAGNHGAGVAYAANVLGRRATVVVPASAPETKRARIAQLGAELVVCDGSYDDAERYARKFAADHGGTFVSPYDDLAVLAGNGASLGYEIAAALGHEPAMVVAPFGGGGLATGLACALPRTRVFGAQSEASAAFALSIERGQAVEALALDAVTLADALEGGISRAAFARASAVVAGVAVVTEQDIARAMAAVHRALGITIEGGTAAAVALVAQGLPEAMRPLRDDEDVVVVVSGRNVDRPTFERVLAQNPSACGLRYPAS